MIILNEKAILVLKEEIDGNNIYIHGYIRYCDGFLLNIGRIKKDQGNFLYDENYVYKWRIDKEYPTVYDIHNRKEEISKEKSKQLINKYKRYI